MFDKMFDNTTDLTDVEAAQILSEMGAVRTPEHEAAGWEALVSASAKIAAGDDLLPSAVFDEMFSMGFFLFTIIAIPSFATSNLVNVGYDVPSPTAVVLLISPNTWSVPTAPLKPKPEF